MPKNSERPPASNELDNSTAVGSAREVFTVALRLGLTSFGGPIAHLGYFRDEYVTRRRWLDDHAYSELIGLCQFLPGPASSQVGFAIGWMRAGALGALAAWVAFTLPSALLLFAFALASRGFRGPVADSVVHGLKLVAVAVVAQALIGMARTLTPDLRRIVMALMAAASMLLMANPATQVLIIMGGALAGVLLCPPEPIVAQHRSGQAPSQRLGIAAIIIFTLLLVALPMLAQLSSWIAFGNAFYRAGALVFGGGHVVLPLLREGLVPAWMSDTTFLSGYGAAQAVPGPLFAIASYLGAVGMPNAPTLGAAFGATLIFLPGLLLVTGALAFRQRIMGSALARRSITGVNAVVVGLLAAAFYDPLWITGIASVLDVILAAAALLLLVRFKIPPVVVVALCVAVNAALAM
jgi:chromate transporter